MMRIRTSSRFALWLGLACICVVGMSIAILLNRMHWTDATSLQHQVLTIASKLHAPGDENTMTAATSSLTSAQHIRYQIQTLLEQGESSTQIMQWMVQNYGPDVLAAPRVAGIGDIAWIAPWAVLAVFGTGAIVFLKRCVRVGKFEEAQNECLSPAETMVNDEIETTLKGYL